MSFESSQTLNMTKLLRLLSKSFRLQQDNGVVDDSVGVYVMIMGYVMTL